MFTGVVFKIECVLTTTFFVLLALCWLYENRRSIVVEVWNAIFLIKFMSIKFMSTLINEDPVVEEHELAVSSDDQAVDQTLDSLDLVSPSFPVYKFSSSQPGENNDEAIEEFTRSIMRVVDLTIKREKTVECCLKYFQFIFFDLNLGKEMYEVLNCHIVDQLNWWHYRIGDSQLEIVGELFGGLIVQGIILNLPDIWRPMFDKVFKHLDSDKDIQYLNFAQSAFKQLQKDVPPRYSDLIKEMMSKPQTANQSTEPVIEPPYANS